MASRNRILHLYNTYSKLVSPVKIHGVPVQTGNHLATRLQGSLYICGPTVYDHCHVGHALTYIRADLFRRFMRNYLNTDLVTVMNITDIDDKILDRSNREFGNTCASQGPDSQHFKRLSDRFYGEFIKDLDLIRVQHADLYMRITDNINIITDYIRGLEEKGHTYVSDKGNIYFSVASMPNYIGNSATAKTQEEIEIIAKEKKDQRDFVIWKKRKENEPAWPYTPCNARNGETQTIYGRPGWHVQCSALASLIFGKKLDFHFGGKDLIFPHHYNETACCCAYHNLDPNKPIDQWCNHWLHSGHVIVSQEKMSKSLGNIVSIKDFIGRSSVNSLRLLCIFKHYSTDLNYDEKLVGHLNSLDHKLNSFSYFLGSSLKSYEKCELDNQPGKETNLTDEVDATLDKILDGLCDGFSLSVGLEAILELSKSFYSNSNYRRLSVRELKSAIMLLSQWFDSCGLDYGLGRSDSCNSHADIVVDSLARFRSNIREMSLSSMKGSKIQDQEPNQLATLVLKECDRMRNELDSLGIVIRDGKSTTDDKENVVVSEKKYNQLADRTLEDLCDQFSDLLEDKYSEGADVVLDSGVLTIQVNQDCIYVINKQTPNRQIWFSSPFSGPKRFDLGPDDSYWVEGHTKIRLHDILSEEFSLILKKSVQLIVSQQ